MREPSECKHLPDLLIPSDDGKSVECPTCARVWIYDAKPRCVADCFDCGWMGNRPDVNEGVVYAMEEPWDEELCPKCGEAVTWHAYFMTPGVPVPD